MRIKASVWWSVVCVEIVCCFFVDSMTNRDLWLRCSLDAGINSMESRHDDGDFVTQQQQILLFWFDYCSDSSRIFPIAQHMQHSIVSRLYGDLWAYFRFWYWEILLHVYLYAGWIMALEKRFWSRHSLSLDVTESSILNVWCKEFELKKRGRKKVTLILHGTHTHLIPLLKTSPSLFSHSYLSHSKLAVKINKVSISKAYLHESTWLSRVNVNGKGENENHFFPTKYCFIFFSVERVIFAKRRKASARAIN